MAVNWDQVRPGGLEILWLSSPELSQTSPMRITRRIDDDYDLWGRSPKTLWVVRRMGTRARARATGEYPKLWEDLQSARRELGWAAEGAIVGGGVRGFPAPTNDPGTIYLFYWRWGQPATLTTRELRSHWDINMEKLVGAEWQDYGFFGVYSTEERIEEGADEGD